MAKKKRSTRRIKAVVYLRCSDKKQDTSIDDQRRAVEQYAKDNGYRIVAEYIDDGISGDSTEKRYGFLEMRDEASTGDFKVVLCWDQDRFGRFDSLEAGHWIYPFRKAGVQLVTLNEGPIDWNDFTTRMMYGIKQEAKHQFLRDLSRNVMRGQVEAAKAGSWIGTAPYAYKIKGKRKQKRLVVDAVKARVVKRIFKEYVDEDRAMNAIAKRLTADGIPTPTGRTRWIASSIKVILENPAYIGTFRYNSHSYSKYHGYRNGEIVKVEGGHRGPNDEEHWIVHENNHEAVVDKRTFDKAQKRLAKGKGKRNNYSPEDNPYLFTGRLRCGVCGGNMHGDKNSCNGRRFYECGRRDDDVTACTGTKVYQDDLIDYLVDEIDELFGKNLIRRFVGTRKGQRQRLEKIPVEMMAKLKGLLLPPDRPKVNQERLRKRVGSLEAKIEKARRNLAYISGKKNIVGVQEEIATMETTVEELRAELQPEPNEKEIEEVARTLLHKLARLQSGDETELKKVIREIDHIVIHSTRKGKHANGLRYHFQRGEIRFVEVGPANSRVNPHPPG